MKRLISILTVAAMTTMMFAQSAVELAQQQRELREVQMRMLQMKPSKSAKKEAKALRKEGWQVLAGEISMEQQITRSQLYGQEPMADEEGNSTLRYITELGMSTSGSYNAAYAAARANAMTELASMMKTQLMAVWQAKQDNAQSSSISATTNDKFNQRVAGIVDQSITNAIPVLTIYRTLQNGNFQVLVRLAFDKKELAARLKRQMQQELEDEGDALNEVVDEMMREHL